ncbi:uncharacterized protein EAE98_004094 [Botrytis deweyae]|uniref:Survival motor neuron Tudor domain-containing protein n=1 Tax=Botrytis deweyae TaxID=2478750 RepID=A0ABQ7ISL6_9HELO|nr:uncharacterized protein EAE98_004094 [Botrytis deweyae]KAF7932795.1 hypothetical protein EAE98_004094 [Botrytis deweyae]
MASKNNASHAEVWDDSTLVDSWNEALQEYEKYHSIHARGEKVEDVLNAFENQSNGLEGEMNEDNGEGVEGVEEPMEENVVMQSEFEQIDDNTQTANEPKVGDKSAPKATKFGSSSSKAPMLPPQLIGQVHDENLKNLLMSWYYAGYYTGLYEGQQQKQEPSKGT